MKGILVTGMVPWTFEQEGAIGNIYIIYYMSNIFAIVSGASAKPLSVAHAPPVPSDLAQER